MIPAFRSVFFFFVLLCLASCTESKEKFAEEIKRGESILFSDTNKVLNTEEAKRVYLNYLKYVEIYPTDTLSPDFLFKAADLANGLNMHDESIRVFERLTREYPSFQKASTALFMEAFIFETEKRDLEKAKEKYAEFLGKYPGHKLAPSAQAALDQLNANLTDEQLIRMFEEKNKK